MTGTAIPETTVRNVTDRRQVPDCREHSKLHCNFYRYLLYTGAALYMHNTA